MENYWKMKNGMIDVTPFLLYESTADSDDVNQDVHHHQQQQQQPNDHQHHYNYQYNNQYQYQSQYQQHHSLYHHQQQQEQNQGVMDDHDAQSGSYDHSFHVNGKTHGHNHQQAHGYDHNHQQANGYDYGHDYHQHHYNNHHGYDDDSEEDVDSKMICQEKRWNELYGGSSNVDDRQFWKNCLGS